MINLFAGISGQDQTISYLTHVYETGNSTHAYLIAGGTSDDAGDIALRFASGLIGGDDESALEEALRGTHPDLHVYSPGGAGSYLVEQIRELTHDAELAPIRSRRKVYVVRDAHRLSGAPANAFLKTLEEPPENVTCILVANSEAAVLETLRSRCEVLVLNTATHAHAVNYRVADMLYALANDCGNRQLLANAKDFVDAAHEQALAMADADEDTEAYLEKYEDYLSQGARKQIEQQGKRDATARDRAALLEMLMSARTWLRDCLVASEGAPQVLACPDLSQQTVAVAAQAGARGLIKAMDAVADAASRISYNVTPQLAIEAMFLEIREALCR